MTRHSSSEPRVRQLINQLAAFVAVLDPEGCVVDVDRSALAVGGLSIDDVKGHLFWDCFWWNYDPAVRADIRQAVEAAGRGEVIRREVVARTVGDGRLPVLFHVGPIYDEDGAVVEIIASGADLTLQKDHERALEIERERLAGVNRELRHRIRNLFAVVQAALNLSAQQSRDRASLLAIARSRIEALAAAHVVGLNEDEELSTDLGRLVEAVVAPHKPGEDSFGAEGPTVLLPAKATTPLALVIHELATNATKHGAWRDDDGRVRMRWAREEPLSIEWREYNDRDASPKGDGTRFGQTLIERSVRQLGGQVEREEAPDGWIIRIAVPLEAA